MYKEEFELNKTQINAILCKFSGIQYQEFDGEIFGFIKRDGENVMNIECCIDFTRDWNLLIPVIQKLGGHHIGADSCAYGVAALLATAIYTRGLEA